MKKTILPIICIVAAVFANAQSPKLEWLKKMVGNSDQTGLSIAVDASGNVYTTGSFWGNVDFDPGTSTFNLTSIYSDGEIFISKLNASGNFVWAKKLGRGTGNSIVVDALGNVYTTGSFSGTVDFDPGSGTFNLTATSFDLFISKLDAAGNFLWAKRIGGTDLYGTYANSIALDKAGNVYTTGTFTGKVDFDPGTGTFNLTTKNNLNSDVFISKLDTSGNFVWAKNTGGPAFGSSIAVDMSGNIYTTGGFGGTIDFDPDSSQKFNLTGAGIFILKLDASGKFVWVKNTSVGYSNSITLDTLGNIYTTGVFQGNVDFDPDTTSLYLNSAGQQDIFISKFNASGKFVWAKNVGGTSIDLGNSIAVDSHENVYITGTFKGTADFDPDTLKSYNLTSDAFGEDIFYLKLDALGNFLWAEKKGGYYFTVYFYDKGCSIALDKSSNIYITGQIETDIFVLKMSQATSEAEELNNKRDISIYPNPANSVINIDMQNLNNNTKIQLLNSLGQIVMEEISSTQYQTFNIQHLPAGLYFVKVISGNNIISAQKLMKQ